MKPRVPGRFGTALIVLALAVPAASAQSLFISHSLGNFPNTPYAAFDPLVEPNTFFVVGTSTTKDLPLDVRSVGVTGTVRFTPLNLWRSSGLNGPDLEVVPRSVAFQETEFAVADYFRSRASSEYAYLLDFEPPYDAIVDQVSVARPALRVKSPSSPCPANGGFCVGRADYVARIDAKADMSSATAYSYVVLSVIIPLSDNTGPFCSSLLTGTPEVFPLEGVVRSVFDAKAIDPARTQISIGVATTRSYGQLFKARRGWQVDLSKPSSPLPADQALVTFNNTSGENRSLWTYDSATCNTQGVNPAHGPFQNIILSPGQSGTIQISRSSVSTIVMSYTINDHGVFAEPNFWPFFGGKHVTITTVN